MRCPNLYFPPNLVESSIHATLMICIGHLGVRWLSAPRRLIGKKKVCLRWGEEGEEGEGCKTSTFVFSPTISPTAPHRPHHNLHAIFPSPILFHRPLPITDRAPSPSQQTTRLTTATAPFDSRIDAASTHRTFQQGRCSSP